MITDLQTEITPYLRRAKVFYIATALINRAGYQLLQTNLPSDCACHYLVGINLPSSPEVLQDLFIRKQKKEVSARIYNTAKTYHPKVYIIVTTDDTIVAFVGSANTTAGGLSRNIEMSIMITDAESCKALISWFEDLYKQGFNLNEPFIEKYNATLQKVKSREASNRADLNKLGALLHPDNKLPTQNTNPLEGQFFRQIYFDAYQKINWTDYSEAANHRRKSVKDRFMELHYSIYDWFEDYGMDDLNCHYSAAHITSSYMYRKGFNQKELKSIWLHYGYDRKQIPPGGSFLNHPRIQIILEHDSIGIWLVVGKDNGAVTERKQFKDQMQQNHAFRKLTYDQVKDLGGSYWISLSWDESFIGEFESPDQLNEFVQEDDYNGYFIIGRTFDPMDDLLSENNIAETVLLEFQRLYPLYKSFSI